MNAIFLTFWGKKYSDDFLKLFLPCFAENLKNIKRDKKNFTLEIWTLLKDKNYIKKNSLFKKVNKEIKCNFKNIDFIINEGKINNMSKYELHETVSYIFKTSQYFKYQYFWFFYPDQFFSNKLILNVSNKTIKKNADLVMMPSLNCNYKKICELLKKKKIFSSDFKKIYLDNLDISNEYVKIENIDKFQYLKVIDILKDSLIIQSFHTHPLVFKTKNNFEGFRYPFYPSLDEGISSFFAKKNTYLINSFNLGILGGTIDFFQKPKEYNNSLKSSIISGLLQFNDCHLKFSKEMFVYKLKNDRNLKERIKKLIKN